MLYINLRQAVGNRKEGKNYKHIIINFTFSYCRVIPWTRRSGVKGKESETLKICIAMMKKPGLDARLLTSMPLLFPLYQAANNLRIQMGDYETGIQICTEVLARLLKRMRRRGKWWQEPFHKTLPFFLSSTFWSWMLSTCDTARGKTFPLHTRNALNYDNKVQVTEKTKTPHSGVCGSQPPPGTVQRPPARRNPPHSKVSP